MFLKGKRCLELKNETDTFNFDHFRTGEADVINEEWLHKSWPFGVEQISLFYGLSDREDVSFFDLIENFMIGIQVTCIYLAVSLSVLLFCLIINEITVDFISSRQFAPNFRKPRSLSAKIDLALKSLDIRKLSTIGVFVLFVNMFFWLTRLFLMNNIKTNKVELPF